MRAFVRRTLQRVGVLQHATDLVDFVRSLKNFRENIPYRLTRSKEGLPTPPDRLIFKVAGTSSIPVFLETGKMAAESIQAILLRKKADLRSFSSILDFGCGCGRVIRWMKNLTHAELYGSDFNPSFIRWCRKNLKFANFIVNKLQPPLLFDDSSFDLVYALSVFTHMDEGLQRSWMSEFVRILKPDGYLVLSIHGEYYLDQLSELEKQKFLSGNLVIRSGGALGSNRFAAYHPFEYFNRSMINGLVLSEFMERGARGNPYQDLYLFQKQKF
ncbi:class I SAM-dependent methyltransferase [bacterium]|nr:class I SAM-dependent methyltransferase [bacterium]MCI0618814.1 class I SAM-dependent methyltransferase [bacterium]